MNTLTTQYLSRAEFWLLISTLIYFLMNGAQIFETAVLIPKWTANAPHSFQLFKGEHGLDLKTFWIVVHSVHEVSFMIAIYFCRDMAHLRNWLLILFAIHFAVRVWTLGYFAPNIIRFQQIANSGEVIDGLQQKVTRWKNLNYLRVGLFIGVSVGVLILYMGM